MTYLVTDACINYKYQDCIEVCPVDYFYEGENIIVINTEEYIDCAVCQPECPVNAILADNAFGVPEEAIKWEEINRKYSEVWPNITQMRKEDVPADAEDWNGVPNKLEEHFSDKPGKGD